MTMVRFALATGALCLAAPAASQDAPTLEFAFEEIVTLGQATSPGDTARD